MKATQHTQRAGGHTGRANPGLPFDLEAVLALRVNRSAVERRAATLPARRTVKKEWQAPPRRVAPCARTCSGPWALPTSTYESERCACITRSFR